MPLCCSAVELCDAYKEQIKKIRDAPDAQQRRAAIQRLTDLDQYSRCFVSFASGRQAFRDFLRELEGLRTDKQPGAGASSEGGTNLVAKGSVAKVFSVAAEHGALTQSVNGQVVTFRGNLAGLPSVLIKKDVFPYCDPRVPEGDRRKHWSGFCFDASLLGQLRKISFGISFDASRNAESVTGAAATGASPPAGTPPTVAFTAKRREIAAVTARYDIWNKRDVISADYQKKWTEQVGKAPDVERAATELLSQFSPLFKEIIDKPGPSEYTRWREEAIDALGGSANLERTWAEQLAKLVDTLAGTIPRFAERIRAVHQSYLRFGFAQDQLIEMVGNQPVVTFEYTNSRPLAQSPISNFRLIVDLPRTKSWAFVLNSALTIYDCPPAQAKNQVHRLRDAQVGAQVERVLGEIAGLGPASLSFAGYFQYQNSPAILEVDPANPLPGIQFVRLPPDAKLVLAEKGNLGIAQVKLVLGPKDGSVKFPIAVSYSNRTELVRKPAWRAQVGISYDFDNLFMK
jgi:hypothetical protein